MYSAITGWPSRALAFFGRGSEGEEGVFSTPRATLPSLTARAQWQMRRLTQLPRWGETNTLGKFFLFAAHFNQVLTRTSRARILSDIGIPVTEALLDTLSICVMVAILAEDHPEDADQVGLDSLRVGYGLVFADLAAHLWLRHRRALFHLIDNYPRFLWGFARLPLRLFDYIPRFLTWIFRFAGETSLTYLGLHMLNDTLNALYRHLEKAEESALAFFSIAGGLGILALAAMTGRYTNIRSWLATQPPLVVQTLEDLGTRCCAHLNPFRLWRTLPKSLTVFHVLSNTAYNTAVMQVAATSIYHLITLISAHDITFAERVTSQALSFFLFSIPTGAAISLIEQVFTGQPRYLTRLTTAAHSSALRENITDFMRRASVTFRTIAVTCFSILLTARYIQAGTASSADFYFMVGSIITQVLMAFLLSGLAYCLENAIDIRELADITDAASSTLEIQIGAETYPVSRRANAICEAILCVKDEDEHSDDSEDETLLPPLIDLNAPELSAYDRHVIKAALAYKRYLEASGSPAPRATSWHFWGYRAAPLRLYPPLHGNAAYPEPPPAVPTRERPSLDLP